ncbi:MAG: nucleotidyltransferase [Myxococcales bacterium]|nr:nucleotidyltransferase [Myxococcales bacterium]
MSTSPEDFLCAVLNEQTLKDDSQEGAALLAEYEHVRGLLVSSLTQATPVIEVGGSMAKGTLVRAGYDLDTICYFANNDDGAGQTLREIRDSVEEALKKEYVVKSRRSALRLTGRKKGSLDFTVDVVPGRYVDNSKQDVFLFQEGGDKERLKTNLRKHIDHIKGSGHTDIIRLVKVWKLRADLDIKTFVLELLVIEALKSGTTFGLEGRLVAFWKALRDDIDDLKVEDPANPTGNDLASIFGDDERETLSAAATIALDLVDAGDWEVLFGKLGTVEKPENRAIVSPRALLALGDTSHAQQHSWPVHRGGQHTANVKCRASSRRGKSFELSSDGWPVTEGTNFRFEATTNVPAPFQVRWQVVNTGAHAKEVGELRGGFIEARTNAGDPSSGLVHRESASYTGKHWVEAFILKDGVLWARSGRFFVNIVSRKRRRSFWKWGRTA